MQIKVVMKLKFHLKANPSTKVDGRWEATGRIGLNDSVIFVSVIESCVIAEEFSQDMVNHELLISPGTQTNSTRSQKDVKMEGPERHLKEHKLRIMGVSQGFHLTRGLSGVCYLRVEHFLLDTDFWTLGTPGRGCQDLMEVESDMETSCWEQKSPSQDCSYNLERVQHQLKLMLRDCSCRSNHLNLLYSSVVQIPVSSWMSSLEKPISPLDTRDFATLTLAKRVVTHELTLIIYRKVRPFRRRKWPGFDP
ncbi:hypothetical protein RRG08_038434 [Elysia crispata]|uniref:Uncharacterized protein n=1 Tax=Elysia crispata TaxID=231223 RepID=A0AAE1AME4_9GAST|nr:hypothetical protein RRG08_038434 [Elysia crispata]